MKQTIANYVLNLIDEHQVIGLGGGSTVAQIATTLSKNQSKHLKVVALSDATRQVCQEVGLTLTDFSEVDVIDWTFDGCDLVDEQFHALKTKGGIQTQEKLLAQISHHYVLLATEEKYQANLSFSLPICCELLPDALPVLRQLERTHQVKGVLRQQDQAFEKTPHGNYLVDISWHQTDSVEMIAQILDQTIGIVSHSLFMREVTDILLGDSRQGTVSRLTRNK